jgi:hypothetical protein
MSSLLVTDLTGLFEIQKNYIAGINTSNDDLSTDISGVQQALLGLNSAYQSKNASAAHILDKQNETYQIINTEKERLLQKKQSIDNALIGKQRAIALNESYRLRQSQVINIKVTIVITLAICILLVLLGRRYPAFPSILITLSILIVLLIGIGYSLFLYSIISSRSKLNYNELDLGGPKVLTDQEKEASKLRARKAGNLLGTINPEGCVGSECCSPGTEWDKELSKCKAYDAATANADANAGTVIVNRVSGFTTMSSSGLVNSPSEYDNYGRV